MSRRSTGRRVLREMMGPEGGKHFTGPAESGTFGAAIAGLAIDQVLGEIWTHPGLDRKARSLITLEVMVALKQPNEFALHMRAGLRNGLTLAENKDIPRQSRGVSWSC